MDLHYKREALVGSIVLVGAGIFVVGTMWLGGKSFGRDNLVPVRFTDIGNVNSSTPVKVSGVQVGKVDRIVFEGVGSVRVDLALTQPVQLQRDASATIEAVGVLGDVEIVLDPGADSVPLAPGAYLQGLTAPGMGGMVNELGDQARAVMVGAQTLLNQRMADDLHQTLKSMQRLMSVYADTRTGPTAEMTRHMVSLQSVSARLDHHHRYGTFLSPRASLLVKPVRFVVLRHFRREAERHGYRDLHQWNFDVEDSDLVFWRDPRRRIRVREALHGSAALECTTEGVWMATVLTRKENA